MPCLIEFSTITPKMLKIEDYYSGKHILYGELLLLTLCKQETSKEEDFLRGHIGLFKRNEPNLFLEFYKN